MMLDAKINGKNRSGEECVSSVGAIRCLSLLPEVMELGHPNRFDSLPLEGLSPAELDEVALAIKGRCLVELPEALATKMALQRQEEKKLHKETIQRDDEKHEALARLVRYAGPETARKAETLEEIEFEIAPEGGHPPNLGVLSYVLGLVGRASGPVDYYEIAEKVLAVFPDLYPPEKWEDPDDRERLGRTLVKRARERHERVRSFDEAISQALREEKTGERFIKVKARLNTLKTKPLHGALKRVGAAGILEQFEEASVAKAKQKEPR